MSIEREVPLWSVRRKTQKIVKYLRDQYDVSSVLQMTGLKNRAYVSWIEKNKTYTGKNKWPPENAYAAVLAYYDANKNNPPFNGVTI